MKVADREKSIHGLPGQSALVDGVIPGLADYLIDGVIAVLALLWFHRDGLRTGAAFAAILALLIGVGLAPL